MTHLTNLRDISGEAGDLRLNAEEIPPHAFGVSAPFIKGVYAPLTKLAPLLKGV